MFSTLQNYGYGFTHIHSTIGIIFQNCGYHFSLVGFIFSYLGKVWVTFPLIWKELWVQILNQNSTSPSKTMLRYPHAPDVQMYTCIYLDGVGTKGEDNFT